MAHVLLDSNVDSFTLRFRGAFGSQHFFKMANKSTIKRANSKEPIRNFTINEWSASVLPSMSFDALLQMVDADPVVSGAVNHYVDKSMEGDWAIVKRDSGVYEKEFEDKLRYDHSFDNSLLGQDHLG